jgi:hypothetical protein
MRQRPRAAALAALMSLVACIAPHGAAAQSARVSSMDAYPEAEASTGYFREGEPLPGAYQLFLGRPESRGGIWVPGRSRS